MGDNHEHIPLSRRDFLQRATLGMGALSLASLAGPSLFAGVPLQRGPHFVPRAKRIIYMNMIGAPSQVDLFDYKPLLHKRHGENLPPGVLGDRIPATSATQATLPMVRSLEQFRQRGESGMWISDLLPYMSQVADELCMINSVYTE
ncbi:MAG: DUF1501 domain-containing protein, partial [Cyclobacteriaceae bacterium]